MVKSIGLLRTSLLTQDNHAKRISLAFHFRKESQGAAARAAYPGSWVQRVELENDNGCLVYVVSLSNGLEVKVDAGIGVMLHQEQEDPEDESQENLRAK